MSKISAHPKGLYLLFATEAWERFSYYGMRALFVLFMSQALLFNKELSSLIYGNYTGLVYLTPLIGGYLSDRYWGNRRSILLGGLIMALGQLLLFFCASSYENVQLSVPLLFAGLFFLVLGNGLFKPNISSMVGELYEEGDSRKDSAYTIFYMGINLGACVAPFWCGLVGNTGNPADFKWGFLSAAVGMVIGTLIFHLGKRRYLTTPDGRAVGMPPARVATSGEGEPRLKVQRSTYIALFSLLALILLFAADWSAAGLSIFSHADWIGAIIYASTIVMPIYLLADRSLTPIERRRITVIYIIAFFVIFFWAAFEQAGASLTFFADEQTDRMIFGWEMPASYFQIFNAAFIILLAPLFAALWSALARRGMEPSSPLKQSIGLFLLAVGYLIIAVGMRGVEGSAKVSMLWLVGLYLMHTMGELALSPIGLSMVNKLTPTRFSAMMMGVWFLSLASANKLSGVLSGYYPEAGVERHFMGFAIADLSDFFMLFVVMSGVAALILFLLSSWLQRMMEVE